MRWGPLYASVLETCNSMCWTELYIITVATLKLTVLLTRIIMIVTVAQSPARLDEPCRLRSRSAKIEHGNRLKNHVSDCGLRRVLLNNVQERLWVIFRLTPARSRTHKPAS